MAVKPKNYFDNRRCCNCGGTRTTQGFGSPRWHKHRCDKKACTGFYCHNCHNKIQANLPDSYDNIKKLMRQCRNGDYRFRKEQCKGCIGVEIVSKTLALKNINIEMDNFNSNVDVSRYEKYGLIEVKTSSLRNGVWQFEFVKRKFDTIFLLCMDQNEPWLDIKIIYAIPIEYIIDKKFEIDKTIYNNVFHDFGKEVCPVLKIKKW